MSKTDEDVLLMYTFQVNYNVTRIKTSPIQFNPRSQFGIFLMNEYANNTVVKLTLRIISTVFPTTTPNNKDLETVPL